MNHLQNPTNTKEIERINGKNTDEENGRNGITMSTIWRAPFAVAKWRVEGPVDRKTPITEDLPESGRS